MTKIKKILIWASGIVFPLSSLSCSSIDSEANTQEDHNSFKTELENKVYEIHEQVREKLNTMGSVNSLYVPSISSYKQKIDEKNGYGYEFKFFNHVTNPLYGTQDTSKLIKISTKDEFENLIIKRYQDLHTLENYKPTHAEIISEFEKSFLNYKNIYQHLENNDLYILYAHHSGAFYYLAAPFITEDSVELTLLINNLSGYVNTIRKSAQAWKVFSLPKKQNFKLNTYFIDNKFTYNMPLEKANEYYGKLNKWYREEFIKYYK